jgi:hypothetical protein
MSNEPQQPLYLNPRPSRNPERPFDGDLFEREALADRLTGVLSRLPDGGVLAIDASWGEGKTWFGRHWHSRLVDSGYRAAYIDCFQRDFVEDPFLMIAGELLEMLKSGKPEAQHRLLEAGKKLGAALLPAAAKLAVNAAGHWVLGNADLADDLARVGESLQEDAASGLESLVSKRLESYETDKQSVEGFRKALQDLASDSEDGKPLLVFLDELDRCRPDFAVRTIERIKHFFEVPNVVFVLLLNRRQLASAIRGVYGPAVDGEAYLGKFVQLGLTLPKRISVERHGQDDNRRYCDAVLGRYGFKSGEATRNFATTMGFLATLFDMSLRDIERAVTLFSFAQPVNATASLICWPIAIKRKRGVNTV